MGDKGEQPGRPRPCGFESGRPCRECSVEGGRGGEVGGEMHSGFDFDN